MSILLRKPDGRLPRHILISTHPPDRSRWLEHGVVDKARERIDLPITHVVVDLATGRAML